MVYNISLLFSAFILIIFAFFQLLIKEIYLRLEFGYIFILLVIGFLPLIDYYCVYKELIYLYSAIFVMIIIILLIIKSVNSIAIFGVKKEKISDFLLKHMNNSEINHYNEDCIIQSDKSMIKIKENKFYVTIHFINVNRFSKALLKKKIKEMTRDTEEKIKKGLFFLILFIGILLFIIWILNRNDTNQIVNTVSKLIILGKNS